MKLKNLFIFVSIFNISLSILMSQSDSTNVKYGVYGGLNYNIHTANFTSLPGIPNCCPRFESGDGFGFNYGFLVDFRLSESLFLSNRLGFITHGAVLSKLEDEVLISPSGPINGEFKHSVDSKLLNLGLEPTLSYYVFNNFQVNLGIRASYLISSTFSQVEEITKPERAGTFVDENGVDTKKRTRNEYSGDIPQSAMFQSGANFGIAYDLPLNSKNTFHLAPELSFYYPITNIISTSDWNVYSLKLNFAIKYSPEKSISKIKDLKRKYIIDTIVIKNEVIAKSVYSEGKELFEKNETSSEIIEQITRTDTLFIPDDSPKVQISIKAIGIDDKGNETEVPKIVVEEYISNRLDPLLNYVFFDENSYKVPERYKIISKDEAINFNINTLYKDSTLAIYHNILNIIGDRLSKLKDSKLTLTGCNADIGSELNNKDLSLKRAEVIKSYLVDNFNIKQDRIKIITRNLPVKASLPKDDIDKSAENRRVEISSDNPKVFEPIYIENVDRKTNYPIIRLLNNYGDKSQVKSWEIKTLTPHEMIILSSLNSNDITELIDWKLSQRISNFKDLTKPFRFQLKVVSKNDIAYEAKSDQIPIELITIQEKKNLQIDDYEVEKFSLILFDFDKAKIESINDKIIKLIKEKLKPNSELEIRAYTDRTGDENYNKKLSQLRAQETVKTLSRPDAYAIGIGEDEVIYNNDLPEGRFYSRTVTITIRNKVER